MNKSEYLNSLQHDLGCMQYNEVQEIIAEISDHFEGGLSKGKTEEQIADELGDVHELAKSYINITPNKLPQALRDNQEKKPAPKGARVFVILFNVFVGGPLAIVWAALDIWLAGLTVTNFIGWIMRFAVMGELGAYLAAGILFQIATFFGTLALLCLVYFGISLWFRLGKKYLKWNRKIWTKGF